MWPHDRKAPRSSPGGRATPGRRRSPSDGHRLRFSWQRHQGTVREPQGAAISGPEGAFHRLVPELADLSRRVRVRADDEWDSLPVRGTEQLGRWIHDASWVTEPVCVELDGGARGGDRVQGRADDMRALLASSGGPERMSDRIGEAQGAWVPSCWAVEVPGMVRPISFVVSTRGRSMRSRRSR